MLSFLCTTTLILLLTVDSHSASASSLAQLPRIIDHGGLFAGDQCHLKADSDTTSFYLEWIQNQGWLKRPCPPGTRFVTTACRCLAVAIDEKGLLARSSDQPKLAAKDQTPGLSPEHKVKRKPFLCVLKPASERGFYLEQIEGHGLLTRSCPEGTDFNAELCVCTGETSAESEIVNNRDEGDIYDKNQNTKVVVNTTPKIPPKGIVNEKEVPVNQFPCNKKEAKKTTSYMELVPAHGWVTRPCPEGTVFMPTECECLIEGSILFDSSERKPDSKGKSNAIKKPLYAENENTGNSATQKAEGDFLQKIEINTDQDTTRGMMGEFSSGDKQNPESDPKEMTGNELDEAEAEGKAGSDSKVMTGNELAETTRSEGTQEPGSNAEPTSGKESKQVAGSGFEATIGTESRKTPEKVDKTTEESVQVIQAAQNDPVQESRNMPDHEIRKVPYQTNTEMPTDSQLKKILDGHLNDKKGENGCKKIADFDPGFYLQLIPGENWVRLACTEGTVFSASQCQCILQASVAPSVFAPGLSGETVTSEEVDEPKATPTTACNMKADRVPNRYLERVQGYGWISRPCPDETTFDTVSCLCISTRGPLPLLVRPTQKTIPDLKLERMQIDGPCQRKPSRSPNHYFQMATDGRWVLMECSPGTTYNVLTCKCVLLTDDRGSGKEFYEGDQKAAITPAPKQQSLKDINKGFLCNKRPADEVTRYQELVPGFGWINRDCPEGTNFNPTRCICFFASLDKSRSTIGASSLPATGSDAQEKRTKQNHFESLIEPSRKLNPAQSANDPTPIRELCLRRPAENPNAYFEITSNLKWVAKMCPSGTRFLPEHCHCLVPTRIHGLDHPDRDTGGHGTGSLGLHPNTANLSLYEKMLASILFGHWNNFPSEIAPAYHPTLTPKIPGLE